MFKASIIVPVYNVEAYLRRCVKSILEQNIDSSEIILIDDGSTDTSGKICDEYSSKYDNIKTIHQTNGGLSAARNTGMKNATGKYVIFVDSDDMLCNNTISDMIEICINEDLDVLCANYCDEYEGGEIEESRIKPIVTSGIISGSEYLKESIRNNCLQMMTWMNIYKYDFLLKQEIYFPEGLNHEDEDWTPRVLEKAKRVIGVDTVFYQYLHRNSSISKDVSKFTKNSLDQIKICYRLKDNITKWEDKELQAMYEDHIATMFFSAFAKGRLYKKEYSDLMDKSFIEGFHLSEKNKTKASLYRLSKHLYYVVYKVTSLISH